MRGLWTITGLILSVSISYGQISKKEYPKYEWNEGSIVFTNNKVEGFVLYDEFERLIQYQSFDKTEMKSFREKDVIMVEIFDKKRGNFRKFYSLPYKYEHLQKEEFFLFEALKEFSTFAIVSRPKTTSAEYVIIDTNGYHQLRSKNFPLDEIFFLNENGLVELSQNESRNRSVFENIIEPTSFNVVLQYMKEENLKFGKKEDILKAMAFYESLEKD
jgi:hypothetical protein